MPMRPYPLIMLTISWMASLILAFATFLLMLTDPTVFNVVMTVITWEWMALYLELNFDQPNISWRKW